MMAGAGTHDESRILAILDDACKANAFPMLDNGYIYLAATRLSLYRSASDWAIVIEVFGYNPRAAVPDVCLYTFGSTIVRTRKADDFVNVEAFERYVGANPNNEMSFVHPLHFEDDALEGEMLRPGAEIVLRGVAMTTPTLGELAQARIEAENPLMVEVYEMCRWLAADDREHVLATPEERRQNVPPDLEQILQLEEWHHPDVVAGALPSATETFRQLVRVIASGKTEHYRPTLPPNTHWRFWPESGTL